MGMPRGVPHSCILEQRLGKSEAESSKTSERMYGNKRPEQRERSVAQMTTLYNDLGFMSHGVGFYDHLRTTSCVAHSLLCELVAYHMSH